jgi:hypothetical protein
MTCPFTKEVWKEVESMIGLKNVWEGGDIEEAFRSWYSKKDTKKIRSLPLNIAWGVWLARNLKLFEGKETLPLKCVIQSLNILNAYPWVEEKQKRHELKEEVINKAIPWAYFDGASQGSPPKGGVGGILYLSSNHCISFKAGIGQESNNYYELMALKLILQLAQEHGVSQIQIFGDSLLVIKWL